MAAGQFTMMIGPAQTARSVQDLPSILGCMELDKISPESVRKDFLEFLLVNFVQ